VCCGLVHQTVGGTRAVQMSTNHSRENEGALRYNSPDCPVCHRTVRCATGLSGVPASNGYPAPMVDCKSTCHGEQCTTEVRAAKSEGTGLFGVTSDCTVPQEDKAPTVDFAPNPNGWVTWRRTGLSGAPIDSSLPNGYGSVWGL
jgi:hypothetical protein